MTLFCQLRCTLNPCTAVILIRERNARGRACFGGFDIFVVRLDYSSFAVVTPGGGNSHFGLVLALSDQPFTLYAQFLVVTARGNFQSFQKHVHQAWYRTGLVYIFTAVNCCKVVDSVSQEEFFNKSIPPFVAIIQVKVHRNKETVDRLRF